MKKIGITGSVGTGKTEISERIGEILGIKVLHLTELLKDLGFEVDIKKAQKRVDEILRKEESLILEGHLLCEMKADFDIVIVLRTNPKELWKRLEKRKYPQEKIEENVLSEMIDYCVQKSEESFENTVQYDTTGRKTEESAWEIIKKMKNWEWDNPDWTNDLIKFTTRKKVWMKRLKG